MDFQPTEDQQHLRAGVRDLLAGRYGREALRASVDAAAGGGAGAGAGGAGAGGAAGVDRALWRELGGAGFFALRLPESEGGVGLGLPEAVLVFEEAGRALVPGPLVATHLAAGVVPGAADGTAVVTAFRPGRAAGGPPRGRGRGAGGGRGARRRAGAFGGPADTAAPGCGGRRRLGVPRDGRAADGRTAARSALRTVELAVRYAGEREQFGQPIGAFQAVKHLCARMLVRAEVARTAVYAAAVTGDPGEVAAAKLLADEAAVQGARDCLQVHGGMGFTWEADVHLHLKRAWVRAEQWRTAAQAQELLAEELLAEALLAEELPTTA